MPSPAIEPALSLWSPFGPELAEKSNTALGSLLISCALPAVSCPGKCPSDGIVEEAAAIVGDDGVAGRAGAVENRL